LRKPVNSPYSAFGFNESLRDADKTMNIVLWIIQALLALLFLFAGTMKFIMSVADMNKQAPVALPGWFLHFIAVCEILGALGLILPLLLGIKPRLTPLAAAGLTVIMAGAIAVALIGGVPSQAILPVIVGVLCILVAYARWRQPVGER
jgi:uncharacterized membrane protein YphA (DoxX/SURF4 family)